MNEDNKINVGLKCHHCGADVAGDSAFCSMCGSKIEHSEPEKRLCPNCSAEVTEEALFCSKCGCKLIKTNLCSNCSAPIEDGSVFCTVCGARVHTSAVPVRAVKKKKQRKYNILTLIRNCVLVLVSVVMLVFSFMSIATYDLSLLGMEADVKLNPVRNTVIFFDTFKDYDEEELMQSDVYGDLKKAAEDFSSEVVGGTADVLTGLFGLENTDSVSLAPETMASSDFYVGGGDTVIGDDDIIIGDSYEEDVSMYDIISMLDDVNYSIKLSNDAQKSLEKVMYLSLRLTAQSEEVEPTAAGTFTMVCSLVFVALSIAFFVVSVVNLLLYLFRKSAPTKSALRLLPTVPLMAVLAYFATANFLSTGGFHFVETKMGIAALMAIIAGAVGVIACAVLNIIVEHKQYALRGILTHSASLVAAVAVICLVFAPVMTTTVEAHIGNALYTSKVKTNIGADYFDNLNLSDDMEDEYEDVRPSDTKHEIVDMLSAYTSATKADIKNGELKYVDYEIMTLSFAALGGGTLDFCGVFALVPVLLLLSAMAAALVAWQGICYFTMGKSMKSITIPAKVLTVLFAMAALAIVIVFCAITNFNLDEFNIKNFECGFSAASIILVVMTVATAAIPMLRNKKRDDDDNDIYEYPTEQPTEEVSVQDGEVKIF